MPLHVPLVLPPEKAADPRTVLREAACTARIDPARVALLRILRRSVDARSRHPRMNLEVELWIDGEGRPEEIRFDYPDVSARPEAVVVGGGPAGLYAALRLIELGLKPVVLERGHEVPRRKRDIAQLQRGSAVDPDSNYAFGEGGAGTFSDGKLFTRSKKRGDYRRALEALVWHGASEEILYEARPHIGSDRLPRIVASMRETIRRAGGTILFGMRVTDLVLRENRIAGVCCGDETIPAGAVILATGHSARDIYELLHKKNILLEPKAFAMGVRVEHPQALIDRIQYHRPERGRWLPAASYTLAVQAAGRGVYSFCMCPGGFIVPALTCEDECVVNGMSPSGRNSPYANSGLVTEIRTADFAHLIEKHGPLAGMRYQQQLEALARLHGGPHHEAPAQRLAEFVAGRKASALPRTSYIPGTVASDLWNWLPRELGDPLRAGMRLMGERMRGWLTDEAVALGVESRTSSPVRIPRDPQTLAHPQIDNLFPAGEGAGYAGGILSAAMDGERTAEAAARYLHGR